MTGDNAKTTLADTAARGFGSSPDENREQGRVVVLVRVRANPGREGELRDLILSSAGRALASPGNHGFSLLVSAEDPADFTIVEHWASRAHHAAHERDPAMPTMAAAIASGKLVETGPQDTFWRQITSTVNYV